MESKDLLKKLKAYEEELDAIRSENKYLRNEIHRIRERCIKQHIDAEREEELRTNKFLIQLRNGSLDYVNDANSDEGKHIAPIQRNGSVDSRVQFENMYSEEQEYRINKIQGRFDKISGSNQGKRAQSPIIISHRREHSNPALLPFLDEYCPALLSHQSTPVLTRSTSTFSGIPLSADALQLLVKSLQYQLVASERTYEKKCTDMNKFIKKLQNENFHLTQRLQYHCEKVGKMSLEKEILFHAFEHNTEKMFNTRPTSLISPHDIHIRAQASQSLVAPVPLSGMGMTTKKKLNRRWSSLDTEKIQISSPTPIEFIKSTKNANKSSDHAL